MEQQTIIFLGRSGCGKGTQSDLLIKYLNQHDAERPVLYLSTGALMRQFWEEDHYSSKLSKEWVEKGDLQPAFVSIYTWSKYLIENANGNEHWIFDGAPRRMNESQVMGSALKFYHRKKPTIIVLEISQQESIKRLQQRHRADDVTVDMIQKRLAWYEKDTAPVIESMHHRTDFRLIKVDGEGAIATIHNHIIQELGIKR